MRTHALLIAMIVATAAPAQQGPATDEYVPPPPPTHAPDGTIYCDARAALPPADRPTACTPRPAQMILGIPTSGSPWQVQIRSTFAYTDAVVAADAGLRPGERAYLAAKPPWERSHRCGGTLIAVDLVLTAAHCVWPRQNGDVLKTRAVRVGTSDLASDEGRVVGIRTAIVPASYDERTFANDIALLRLDWGREVPLLPVLGLAGAGQADATPGRTVAVTGWGLTGARDPGGDAMLTRDGAVNHASPRLQELYLSVLPQAACDAVPRLRTASGPRTVCARAVREGADSCQGDSGGPMTLRYLTLSGYKTILVGIVSQGIGCAYEGLPSLYTRVSAWRGWIDRARAVMRRGFVRLP